MGDIAAVVLFVPKYLGAKSVAKRPAPAARYRNAPRRDDFTIDQNWTSYSPAEHDRWDRLFARSQGCLATRACPEFLDALHRLELSRAGIPNMAGSSDIEAGALVASDDVLTRGTLAHFARQPASGH